MKLRAAWCVALVLLAIGAGNPLQRAKQPQAAALAPGDPAPRLAGTDFEGKPRGFDYATARATLINFWAPWCVPCRGEMPILQELWSRRSGDGLAVVGIDVDRGDLEISRKFVADLKLGYPMLRIGPDDVYAWGGLGILPTAFLVGGDGKVVRRYVGGTPAMTSAMVSDTETFLAGKPLGTLPMPDEMPPKDAVPADRR
jgi:thiol-disulfide isomerase/thioredoxin